MRYKLLENKVITVTYILSYLVLLICSKINISYLRHKSPGKQTVLDLILIKLYQAIYVPWFFGYSHFLVGFWCSPIDDKYLPIAAMSSLMLSTSVYLMLFWLLTYSITKYMFVYQSILIYDCIEDDDKLVRNLSVSLPIVSVLSCAFDYLQGSGINANYFYSVFIEQSQVKAELPPLFLLLVGFYALLLVFLQVHLEYSKFSFEQKKSTLKMKTNLRKTTYSPKIIRLMIGLSFIACSAYLLFYLNREHLLNIRMLLVVMFNTTLNIVIPILLIVKNANIRNFAFKRSYDLNVILFS